jgi:hypothetical protein
MPAALLNAILTLCKWPTAVLAVLLLFPALGQLWVVAKHFYQHTDHYQTLFYGVAAYFALSWLWFKRSPMGEWFSTLEHELTHALFAALTLNRVTGLNATSHAGGVTHYHGYGNWLVTLAPYFVPTLSLLVLGIMQLAKNTHQPVLMAVMGFTLAYHAQSTWHETHTQQTDLQESGWLFCWLFLPAANVLMLLVVLAALPGDFLTVAKTQTTLLKSLSY